MTTWLRYRCTMVRSKLTVSRARTTGSLIKNAGTFGFPNKKSAINSVLSQRKCASVCHQKNFIKNRIVSTKSLSTGLFCSFLSSRSLEKRSRTVKGPLLGVSSYYARAVSETHCDHSSYFCSGAFLAACIKATRPISSLPF